MSITPVQRAYQAWASRPPGPASFWYAFGTAVRSVGRMVDELGVSVQGDCAYHEKLPLPCTVVKYAGKAPSVDAAAFVAPSANLIGAVELGRGASVWYSSLIKGDKAGSVLIGELASVGDRAIVNSSTIGKNATIGAGAIVSGAIVGDGSSVGMGAKVGTKSSIGAGAILAAGSVLKPGTTIPPKQLWAGVPAAYVREVSADEAEGLLVQARFTADMATLHCDEAWKDVTQVEVEAADYKRETERTPQMIASQRFDPKWVPLPTLGGYLEKIGAFDLKVPSK